MASYLDKTQVNTAITDNTKLDLGHQHITTADFMQLNVDMIHEMVPGEKIDIKMESFARLNPLPVPTFGRARMVNRAFAVPFRTIFRGWNDYITDNVHIASDGVFQGGKLLSTVPYVTMESLVAAFTNNAGSAPTDSALSYLVSAPGAAYDFVFGANNDHYCYTIAGRQAIKLLESLGYKVDYSVEASSDARNTTFSALPLLALAKIYVDWYYPTQYASTTVYDRVYSWCNYDLSQGPLELDSAAVATILQFCSYVNFDSDYFVSAWDTPNQPAVGNVSTDFKLVNIDSVSEVYSSALHRLQENGYVTNNSALNPDTTNRIGGANAPFIVPYVNTLTGTQFGVASLTNAPISEYLLHSLHALTDYMKRH